MNYVSMGISGIFALLTLAFTLLLLAAIINNLKTGRRYRQAIGKRLSGLRLSRMLSFRHIDSEAYLHAQRIVDIEAQMKRCSNCPETERCDRALDEAPGADTGFCHNDSELRRLRDNLGDAA